MDEQLTATTLAVEGMDCAGCGRKIEKALLETDGVRDVSLHYPDTTLGILHEPGVGESEIRAKVEALGYSVHPVAAD